MFYCIFLCFTVLSYVMLCVHVMKENDKELQDLWDKLSPMIPRFFGGLEIEPALLHGDLWSGNVAENDSGPGETHECSATCLVCCYFSWCTLLVSAWLVYGLG